MKKFMDRDFLLDSETAKELYAAASAEPIFDYHCHLSPKEIYENSPPADIAQLWLSGDHYKWRVMRGCGIDEKYITGNGSGYEKFKAWAAALPYCIGNPLYHWTHLELQRFFGIDTPLSPSSADEIWKLANEKIQAGGFRPREMIRSCNVAALCTTDDPADSLEYHRLISEDKSFTTRILPAFRPDRALQIEAAGFADYIARLAGSENTVIENFGDLKAVLSKRVEYFAKMGCVASDHSFPSIPCCKAGDTEVDLIFRKALGGSSVGGTDADKYKTALLTHLCGEYAKHRIAMELHIGALRNNSTKMFRALGPDAGYDSINDREIAEPLSRLLDSLEQAGSLPKTILFAMNPKDNYVLGSMAGNFQTGEAAGKIQLGPAWWMNDHAEGMTRQMTDLADLGVLGKFVGMVTDSRSFLSYPRHEYFRRILCNLIGNWVESGQYPDDRDILTGLVKDISYRNAKNYFGV